MKKEKLIRIKLTDKNTVVELQNNEIRIKNNMVAGVDIARLMGYTRNSVIYDHVKEEDRKTMSFTDSATNLIFINKKGLINLMDGASKCENYHREYINKYILPELEDKPKVIRKVEDQESNNTIKDLKARLKSLKRENKKRALEIKALNKRVKEKAAKLTKVDNNIHELEKIIRYLEEEI